MKETNARSKITRFMMPTTAADIEYFCKSCKGHYSRIVPVDALRQTRCRCGSSDLLVYSIAGEATAPLRAS